MKVFLIAFLLGFAALAPISAEVVQFHNFRAPIRFQVDAAKSKFFVHASRGGIAWFKGHSHNIAVRDFDGTAELDITAINPASLELNVRAASLEETDPAFTPEQKGIINKELNEIVLETAKFPDIVFKSTAVAGKIENGGFEIVITGDLSLHGVTRQIKIPARVTLEGDSLRAIGEFEIDRKDFKIAATSAFHGFVRVKHDLKFTFDIVAARV
ncbi:MAG: YceI family protein [Acidobacteria bacterium]|nr:YceI family protein [Acidobacteriota bacterium]